MPYGVHKASDCVCWSALSLDMPGYRDALCGQIGKLVVDIIDNPTEELCVRFVDDVTFQFL